MRARKPETDQEAVVEVSVNQKKATEYVLPTDRGGVDGNLLECFIPVKEGDLITVKASFSGSVRTGQMDLLVDASFLADSRIEGQDIKLVQNRTANFKKALSCPIPDWWRSIESPKDLVEGTLRVTSLEKELEEFAIAAHLKPGVGSLQVIMSIGQQPQAILGYSHHYPDITNGHWKKRDAGPVRKSGIMPDFEIKLQFDPEDDEYISLKRSAKHRRHFDQTRCGASPWANFIFYYRSAEAIKNAGCIPRQDTVEDLPPGDKDLFERASLKTNKKQQAEQFDREDKMSAMAVTPPAQTMMGFSKDNEKRTTAATERRASEQRMTPGGVRSAPKQQVTPRKEPLKRLGGTLHLNPKAAAPAHNAEGNDLTDGKHPLEITGARDGAASEVSGPSPRSLNSNTLEALAPPNTNQGLLPSSPQSACDMTRAGPSVAEELARIPPVEKIAQALRPEGVDYFALSILMIDAGPFRHEAEANEEFERRRDHVAVYDSYEGLYFSKEVWEAKQAAKQAPDESRRDSTFDETRDAPTMMPSPEELADWFANGEATTAPPDADAADLSTFFDDETRATAAKLNTESADFDELFGIENPRPPVRPTPEAGNVDSRFGDDQLFLTQPEQDLVVIKQEEIDGDEPTQEVPPQEDPPSEAPPSEAPPSEAQASEAPPSEAAPSETPKATSAAPSTPQPKTPQPNSKRPTSERPASSTPGTASPATKRAKNQNSELRAKLQQQLASKQARKADMQRRLKEKQEAKEARQKRAEEKRKREEEEIAELQRLNDEEDAELKAMEDQLMKDDDDNEESDEDDWAG